MVVPALPASGATGIAVTVRTSVYFAACKIRPSRKALAAGRVAPGGGRSLTLYETVTFLPATAAALRNGEPVYSSFSMLMLSICKRQFETGIRSAGWVGVVKVSTTG